MSMISQVPPTSDAVSRRTLKRLQEVSVGIIAPIDQLLANPLPNAVRQSLVVRPFE